MSPRAWYLWIWITGSVLLLVGAIVSGNTVDRHGAALTPILGLLASLGIVGGGAVLLASFGLEDSQRTWRNRRLQREYDRGFEPSPEELAWREAKAAITKGVPRQVEMRDGAVRWTEQNDAYEELTSWVDEQRCLIKEDRRVWARVAYLLDGGDVFDDKEAR